MNFILINQYYPPDGAPTGLMLEAAAGELVALGHDVTILCSAGGYAATAAGAAPVPTAAEGLPSPAPRVVRCWSTTFGRASFLGKLLDYGSFYLGVTWELLTLRPAPDRLVALTTPPYLSVLARLIGKVRGADHAHWVMDLYPDVMSAHGMIREGDSAHRLLAGLARFGFGGRRRAAVVTLGPDMAERVARHLPADGKVEWVPLWDTEGPSNTDPDGSNGAGPLADARLLRRERGWGDEQVVLMYSGNMGLGHRFGEFLAAAARAAKTPAVRFTFFGSGKRRPEIESFIRNHPAAPLELHDHVPRGQLAAHLRSADVHLASLEPAWDGTMVPSKLQGIFAAGRPVIFIGSRHSAIGRWIGESGGGWVVPPDDPLALDAAIRAACDPAERHRRAAAARNFAGQHFDGRRNARITAEILARPTAARGR
jgi:colanic acid biosynthesis glycosyl transferase WcaI